MRHVYLPRLVVFVIAVSLTISKMANAAAICEPLPGISCRVNGAVAEYTRTVPNSTASGEWFKSHGISVAPWGRSVALLVGVSDYQNANLPKLEFVRRNLADLRKFLLLEERFDEVDVFRDGDVTSQALDNLMMNAMPTKLAKDSRFLFYFAGHGLDAGAGVGYMIFSGHPDPDKAFDSAQALDVSVTKRWAGKLPAKYALFLLDGCALGLGLEEQSANAGTKTPIQRLTDDPARIVFAATRGAESTYGNNQGLSYFTGELLNALHDDKADPTANGFINIRSIAEIMNPHLADLPLPVRATTEWYNKVPLYLLPRTHRGSFFFINTKTNLAIRKDSVPNSSVPPVPQELTANTDRISSGIPSNVAGGSLADPISGEWEFNAVAFKTKDGRTLPKNPDPTSVKLRLVGKQVVGSGTDISGVIVNVTGRFENNQLTLIYEDPSLKVGVTVVAHLEGSKLVGESRVMGGRFKVPYGGQKYDLRDLSIVLEGTKKP